MRWCIVMGVLIVTAGCRPDRLTTAEAVVVVPPALELPRTTPNVEVTRALEVANLSAAPVELTLSGSPPFSNPTVARLEPGMNFVTIGFTPTAAGHFSGTLVLEGAGQRLEVALTGTSVEALVCAAASACVESRFDADTATCVERPRPEGSSCRSRCVTAGQCHGQQCEGTAVDCSDGDACTVDACDETSGCLRVPRVCQASGPCKVSSCDARLGCTESDAADGTACGPSSCDVAAICLSGACVERPRPAPHDCDGFLKCGARHCAVLDVAVHERMACALLDDGSVQCWPRGEQPRPVTGLTGPAVALGHGRSAYRGCVATAAGVECWADRPVGNSYRATLDSREAAERVGLASTDRLCTLARGTLTCRGSAGWATPISIDGGFTDLDLGRWGDVCALDGAGRIRCWGWYQPTPGNAATANDHLVSGLGGRAVALDYGSGKACARVEDGGIACWGSSNGHRSLGPTFFDAVPIPLGADRYLLDVHDSIRVVGRSTGMWSIGFGIQPGEGPLVEPGDAVRAGVVHLETSASHTCELTEVGRVFCR